MNNTLIRLINQSIRYFKLDLTGLNVLAPLLQQDKSLVPIMAAMAGAKTVYVSSKDVDTTRKTRLLQSDFGITNEIRFITSETPEIIKDVDIILKNKSTIEIDETFTSKMKKGSVITLLPENLDFTDISGIDLKAVSEKDIPVIALNPADYSLMLYRYFGHLIIKRCHNLNIEVFRSRLLLIGHGEILENTLSLLKAAGAQVFVFNTDKTEDNDYLLKHLPEMDGIVVLDYPQKFGTIIGTSGLLSIEEIEKHNPDIKIIHMSGIIDEKGILLANIQYQPDKLLSNSLSIKSEEIGLRLMIEATAAVLKAAECLIKVNKKTILQNECVVSYKLINQDKNSLLKNGLF